MESRQEKNQTDIEQILFNGLNEHGFVFQEKCAEILRTSVKDTRWLVKYTEYPVETETKSTRIDIVLEYYNPYFQDKSTTLYAIVECKRVNLSHGYWLFGKPSEVRNREAHIIQVKGGHEKTNYSLKYLKPQVTLDIRSILIENWWLQISKKSGRDKYNSSPQPIEEAFLQVCTGVSGLSNEIYGNMRTNPRDYSVMLIPIIITTAPLYYAGYDLIDVDLTSGNIKKEKVFFGDPSEGLRELEWVQVNYPTSRSILPRSTRYTSKIDSFSGLITDYQSTIFIVNSDYITKFFSRLSLF